MNAISHKIIDGKQRCDRCKQQRPPIREMQFQFGDTSHWADLCSACAAECTAHPRVSAHAFWSEVLFPTTAVSEPKKGGPVDDTGDAPATRQTAVRTAKLGTLAEDAAPFARAVMALPRRRPVRRRRP